MVQLVRGKRRLAFLRFREIRVLGFFCIPIAFHGAYCPPEHRGVAAALRNGRLLFVASRHVLVEFVPVEEVRERLAARMELDLGIACPVEESRRVERVRIQVGEDLVQELLQRGISLVVGHRVDLEEQMETRPCGLPVLGTIVVAAVVDGEEDAGQRLPDIRWRLPARRIIRVVVVAVDGKAVRGDEVVVAAVVVPVLGAHVVVRDGSLEARLIDDFDRVRVDAVGFLLVGVGRIDGEHQSYTSLDSSSSTCVMNLSAVIMVASSQSPPRVTSKPPFP